MPIQAAPPATNHYRHGGASVDATLSVLADYRTAMDTVDPARGYADPVNQVFRARAGDHARVAVHTMEAASTRLLDAVRVGDDAEALTLRSSARSGADALVKVRRLAAGMPTASTGWQTLERFPAEERKWHAQAVASVEELRDLIAPEIKRELAVVARVDALAAREATVAAAAATRHTRMVVAGGAGVAAIAAAAVVATYAVSQQ